MNYAHPYNYPGAPDLGGTAPQEVARAQAIISAGGGVAAALDVLSIEVGRDIRDWDTPARTGG